MELTRGIHILNDDAVATAYVLDPADSQYKYLFVSKKLGRP